MFSSAATGYRPPPVSSTCPCIRLVFAEQAPLPAVCPTPPLMDANANQEVDLNDALRQIGVTFNVSVKGGDGVARRRKSLDDVGAGGDNGGETKCRAEGDCDDDDVARGLSPSAAAAAANRKVLESLSSEKMQQQQHVGFENTASLTAQIDVCVS